MENVGDMVYTIFSFTNALSKDISVLYEEVLNIDKCGTMVGNRE